jgi:hypothetical protein
MLLNTSTPSKSWIDCKEKSDPVALDLRNPAWAPSFKNKDSGKKNTAFPFGCRCSRRHFWITKAAMSILEQPKSIFLRVVDQFILVKLAFY